MKKHINKDFFSQREAAKYDNPIPSREYILDFLAQSRGPLTHDELCEELGISDERA
jgi:ribonuclease R